MKSTPFIQIIGASLVASMLIASMPGCQQQEGPAELAGKEVDKAAGKVGQQLEKAGDKIQDAAQGNKK